MKIHKSLFFLTACAANLTVAAQLCDCMKNIHLVIWMHGEICVGSISLQALCKVCRLVLFHNSFWSNVKKL